MGSAFPSGKTPHARGGRWGCGHSTTEPRQGGFRLGATCSWAPRKAVKTSVSGSASTIHMHVRRENDTQRARKKQAFIEVPQKPSLCVVSLMSPALNTVDTPLDTSSDSKLVAFDSGFVEISMRSLPIRSRMRHEQPGRRCPVGWTLKLGSEISLSQLPSAS